MLCMDSKGFLPEEEEVISKPPQNSVWRPGTLMLANTCNQCTFCQVLYYSKGSHKAAVSLQPSCVCLFTAFLIKVLKSQKFVFLLKWSKGKIWRLQWTQMRILYSFLPLVIGVTGGLFKGTPQKTLTSWHSCVLGHKRTSIQGVTLNTLGNLSA